MAVPPDRVVAPDADSVVNAPAAAVVAPTVPLIFIDAVPVRFVTTPLLGVPSAGVTRVGLVFKTLLPVPVLATLTTFLLTSRAKAVEAVSPAKLVTPDVVSVVNAPVDGVEAPIVPLIFIEAVPVRFVTTPLAGVPSAGVTNVGDVDITTLPVPVMALDTKFLDASVNTATDAVKSVT